MSRNVKRKELNWKVWFTKKKNTLGHLKNYINISRSISMPWTWTCLSLNEPWWKIFKSWISITRANKNKRLDPIKMQWKTRKVEKINELWKKFSVFKSVVEHNMSLKLLSWLHFFCLPIKFITEIFHWLVFSDRVTFLIQILPNRFGINILIPNTDFLFKFILQLI